MRYWIILFGIVSSAYAYDPQLSIFANTSPSRLLAPGLSVELANTYALRTVIGAQAGITEPDTNDERDFLFALNGRFLYSNSLSSQWYPQASVSWLAEAKQFDTWLGLGIQSEVTPEAGYFAEVDWRTGSDRFAVKLGLRLWLGRFSSLDARVGYSEPIGFTYRPNKPPTNVSTEAIPTAAENETLEQPVLDLDDSFVLIPEIQISSDEQGDTKPNIEIPTAPIVLANEDHWYVHLGLFEHMESIEKLQDDIRLAKYREQVSPWYDPSRAYIRLLMGPYEKSEAQVMLTEIKRLKLDGFLFQKPN